MDILNIKSDSRLPEQSLAMCGLVIATGTPLQTFLSTYNPTINLSIHELMIIEAMLITGCRISEILNLNSSQITANGLVKLAGLKGSSDIIFRPVSTIEYYRKIRKLKILVFSNYNRYYMYRLFLRIGCYGQYRSSSRLSVTHFFRKQLALEAYSIANKDSDISNVLHHNSKRSASYYN